MFTNATVLFSMQTTTVIYEHVRLASRLLKKNYDLGYNEFSVLFVLLRYGRPASVDELSNYLMLAKSTVLALLVNLDNRCLIHKENASDDHRLMACSLSSSGCELVSWATEDVGNMLRNRFMRSLPREEFQAFADISEDLDVLRGYSVLKLSRREPAKTCGKIPSYWFSAEHYIFWRVIVDRWTDVIKRYNSLSFDAFRILELVAAYGDMSLGTIANRLFMQKSGVTIYKNKLLKDNLLTQHPNPFDRRGLLVRCTAQGRLLAGKVRADLDEVMRSGHSSLTESEIIVLDAWYMRMYVNMHIEQATL
ncbi:MAG: winged helix-turn-helix transcriptional regulator [Coriobacteriaceae bacterium]|nr:winged helix-turn-helix transcriptional regulator [Coriobacteriaceae bacterium]